MDIFLKSKSVECNINLNDKINKKFNIFVIKRGKIHIIFIINIRFLSVITFSFSFNLFYI